VSAVGSTSLLNTYDPLNPASALTSAPAAASATPVTAPATAASTSTDPIDNSTPAGFDVLKPVPNAAPAGPSSYQQALDAFTVTADTYLIQSALNGQQQQQLSASAAFGSPSAQLASLGNTIDVLKNASLSGNYGSLDSVA
jgi:hypothetical protein